MGASGIILGNNPILNPQLVNSSNISMEMSQSLLQHRPWGPAILLRSTGLQTFYFGNQPQNYAFSLWWPYLQASTSIGSDAIRPLVRPKPIRTRAWWESVGCSERKFFFLVGVANVESQTLVECKKIVCIVNFLRKPAGKLASCYSRTKWERGWGAWSRKRRK